MKGKKAGEGIDNHIGQDRHKRRPTEIMYRYRSFQLRGPAAILFISRDTFGHPRTCVYPDVCLGIAHVSGKVPLSGQGVW